MKWLVFLLACLNTGVYLLATNFAVESDRRVAPDGQLPGVGSLRMGASSSLNESSDRADEGGVCLQIAGISELEQPQLTIREAAGDWQPLRISPVRPASSQPLHRLMVPPMASRDAALARLEQLQSAGIDSYLLEEGPHQWAISLGVFESAEGARRLSSRYQSRNIETILVKRPPDPVGYALVFPLTDAPAEKVADGLRTALPETVSIVVRKGCQGVASPDKNP